MKIRIQPKAIAVPVDDPFANDTLNRKEFIEVITHVMEAIDGPCVVGIDGPWGSGKTTFLQIWAQHLLNEGFPVVSFNAWETDFSGDPFLALSDEMWQGLQRYKGGSFDAKIDEIMTKAKEVALRAVPGVIRVLTAGILDVAPILEKEVIQGLGSYAQERVSAYQGARQSVLDFRDVLDDTARELSLSQDGRPLIVMIDELDRCRPSYAAALLEVAKHIFVVDHIVFVLAVNRDQLEHSIRALYGDEFDGQGYLRRFFDIDLHLPEADRERFIQTALRAINVDDYLARTSDQTAQRQMQAIHELLLPFFTTSAISLRTINQAIHHLGLVLATLHDNQRMLGLSAAVALIVRAMDPSLYQRFIRGEISDAEVCDSILGRIGLDDSRWEHERCVFEATLISGALDIRQSRAVSQTDTKTPLWQRYEAILAENPEGRMTDPDVRHASSVIRRVQESLHSITGRPSIGFAHAVRRLELLSTDLIDGDRP